MLKPYKQITFTVNFEDELPCRDFVRTWDTETEFALDPPYRVAARVTKEGYHHCYEDGTNVFYSPRTIVTVTWEEK